MKSRVEFDKRKRVTTSAVNRNFRRGLLMSAGIFVLASASLIWPARPHAAGSGEVSAPLLPDLRVGALDSCCAQVQAGRTFTLTMRVDNQGDGDAGGTVGAIYLSASASASPSDVTVAIFKIPAISAGQGQSVEITAQVPQSTTAGQYHVRAGVDIESQILEHDENNNGLTAANTLQVISAQAALVRISVSTICEGCLTGPVQIPQGQIRFDNPNLGYQNTPFGFDIPSGILVILKAPPMNASGGKALDFLRWVSVDDGRVITTSQTLLLTANTSERVAAVYGVRVGGADYNFIGVQAVRVADDDGNRRARITPHEAGVWIDAANRTLADAGIQLLFDRDIEGPDWLEVNDTIINNITGEADPNWVTERDRANAIAARQPKKLTIIFRWGNNPTVPTGGGFSWSTYNFVAMPGFNDTGVCGQQNIGLMGHEVGHYFGLAHTFTREFSSVQAAEDYLVNQMGKFVRMTGDFNGDKKDDIVTFTRGDSGDVFVSLSHGGRFGPATRWHESFCFGDEIPRVGDFNNDGKDDIVTFTRGGAGDVFVAVSTGGGFSGTGAKWHDFFCIDDEVPIVGDFNGDGKDDIATFTRGESGDVYVATSTGGRFSGTGIKWHDFFCIGEELPAAGDFDNDGDDDIATFTRGESGDVYVALSSRKAFIGTGVKWHDFFCLGDQVPSVGDFNNDGKDDIVTFTRGGHGDVYVALAGNSKFVGTGVVWHDFFCIDDETPAVGDFNGDRRDDVVTFTQPDTGDVYAALSDGSRFNGLGVLWHEDFTFYQVIFDGDGLSDTEPDPNALGDLNGDNTQCGPTPASITLAGLEFRLPRTNVMSYYHPDSAAPNEVRRLTPQQITRVHEVLRARFNL